MRKSILYLFSMLFFMVLVPFESISSYAMDSAAGSSSDPISFQSKFEILKAKSIFNESRPNDRLTRAEFATILTRLLEMDVPENQEASFDDTKTHWSKDIVERIHKAKLVEGKTDRLFYPDDPLTIEETKIIMDRTGLPQQTYSTLTPSKEPIRRQIIIEIAYEVYAYNQFVPDKGIGVKNASAVSANQVEVTFTNSEKQTFSVSDLQAGVPTWVNFNYKGKEFKVTATWNGHPANKIKPLKTRVNVHAGEVTKDKLTYVLLNDDGIVVPMDSGMKVEFNSNYEQISSDGWFDNTKNPLPSETKIEYTIVLKDNKNQVIDSAANEVTVYETPQGVQPNIIRYIDTSSSAFWNFGYVTMNNNGINEPWIKAIVTKATKSSGEVIDQYTGKADNKEENIGTKQYYSMDERIAKIDDDGKITPVSTGVAQFLIVVGDHELTFRTSVYGAPVPEELVYNDITLNASDTKLSFKVKDQFGQNLRSDFDPSLLKIATKSGSSGTVDLTNSQITANKGDVTINNLLCSKGEENLLVYYQGHLLGQISVTVR